MKKKMFISSLMLFYIIFLTGCQTVQPKIVLDTPIISLPPSANSKTENVQQRSNLIQVKDLRWDPVLIGKDKHETYIDLEQGNKMSSVIKRHLLSLIDSKGICASTLMDWMGEKCILNFVILEIAMGQGEFAKNPSKALALREKKWLAITVSTKGSAGCGSSGWSAWRDLSIPVSKMHAAGAGNDVGAKISLGMEVLDIDNNSLLKRVVVGQELISMSETDDFKGKAQTALESAYSHALHKLVDLVISKPIIERLKDTN